MPVPIDVDEPGEIDDAPIYVVNDLVAMDDIANDTNELVDGSNVLKSKTLLGGSVQSKEAANKYIGTMTGALNADKSKIIIDISLVNGNIPKTLLKGEKPIYEDRCMFIDEALKKHNDAKKKSFIASDAEPIYVPVKIHHLNLAIRAKAAILHDTDKNNATLVELIPDLNRRFNEIKTKLGDPGTRTPEQNLFIARGSF